MIPLVLCACWGYGGPQTARGQPIAEPAADAAMVCVARHAESFKNLDSPPADLTPEQLDSLTPRGEEQARALAATLGRPVTLIWTSPANRTRQTAELLGLEAAVEVESDLRSLEGALSWDERLAAWAAGEDPRPDDGESLADGNRRAVSLLQRLRMIVPPGEYVVLVTHSDIASLLLGELRGTPLLERPTTDTLGIGQAACLPLAPAAPSATARYTGTTGPLQQVSLLGGRYTMQAAVDAERRPAPHSIMAAPTAEEEETSILVQRGDERVALIVRDAFLLCGDDFEATARAQAAIDEVPEPYAVRPLATADATRIIALVPDVREQQDDVVTTFEAALCHPDGTLQWARFMVASGEPGRLADEWLEPALAMLTTLVEGPTERRLDARRVTLPTYIDDAPLSADLPAGWANYSDDGPDFRVHRLVRLRSTPGGPSAGALVYLGDHPSPFATPEETLAGTLFGEPTEWLSSEREDGWRSIEQVLETPVQTGTRFVHVSAGGDRPALFEEARAVVESLQGTATSAP